MPAATHEGVALAVAGAERTEDEGEELPRKVGDMVPCGMEPDTRFMWRTDASGGSSSFQKICKSKLVEPILLASPF